MDIPIKCPWCGHKLFELEPATRMGEERIKIKCNRCRSVLVIQPKKYDRTEQMAAQ